MSGKVEISFWELNSQRCSETLSKENFPTLLSSLNEMDKKSI